MLHSLTGLRRFRVHAADGDIGQISDGYFDDERWVVRHLVVNAGSWLGGRAVLISPHSVSRIDQVGLAVVTHLTRKQIEEGPESPDARLRSARDVTGYHIQASDDAAGHAEDLLFDDRTWAIRYLAVDTRNWLPGKHVLISTQRIRSVSWAERSVVVNLTRSAIEQSPQYDPKHLPSRADEADPYRRYQRRGGEWG